MRATREGGSLEVHRPNEEKHKGGGGRPAPRGGRRAQGAVQPNRDRNAMNEIATRSIDVHEKTNHDQTAHAPVRERDCVSPTAYYLRPVEHCQSAWRGHKYR